MEDLPTNLPEHLAAGIHAGWLNVHSKKLEGADTDLCLQEAYDVCAKAMTDRGHELDDVVLRKVIPSWVIHFAGVKGWFGDPPDDWRKWHEDLMKCLSSRIEFWGAEAPRLIEKQLLPPELPEHVATRILAELLRVHSRKLEGADVDFCLREAYDVYARAAVDDGQDLSDEVLRAYIPAWVVHWAVAKEWVRRPADLPPNWYQNLTQRLQGRMVHWQAEALTLREKQDRQSRLHERWEAAKEITSLMTGPHEEIPEAFLRCTLAEQYGIDPTEVTWDQIWLEISHLCASGGYRAVEVVPTVPATDEDQERLLYVLPRDTIKALHDHLVAYIAANPFTDDESSPPEEDQNPTPDRPAVGDETEASLTLQLHGRQPMADPPATEAAAFKEVSSPAIIDITRAAASQAPPLPTTRGKADKGNLELLRDKDYVTVQTACRFGGVKPRAIQAAIKKGSLVTVGVRQNLRISVDSLLKYFPPENSAH